MNQLIKSSIQQDEIVISETAPDFARNLLSVPYGVFLMVVALFLITSSGGDCAINGVQKTGAECDLIGHVIGYVMFAAGILIQIPRWILPFITEYVITNRRVIIKSGIIGADFRSIYYTQIRSVFTNVGLIDKLFGTGTVSLDTGYSTMDQEGVQMGLYTKLISIELPYEVANKIQEQLGK